MTIKVLDEEQVRVEKKRRSSYDDYSPLQFKDSGVQKLLLLAVAPVTEKYDNLHHVMRVLELDGFEFGVISADLKMCLLLLGKQGASSTHCCPFCTSSNPWLDEGETTTIRTLWRDYNNFLADPAEGGGGGVKERAKEFNNVVNPPLVTCQDGAEDKMILGEVVFFPEHHVRIEFFIGHLKQTN